MVDEKTEESMIPTVQRARARSQQYAEIGATLASTVLGATRNRLESRWRSIYSTTIYIVVTAFKRTTRQESFTRKSLYLMKRVIIRIQEERRDKEHLLETVFT